jgi:hypothetical protein
MGVKLDALPTKQCNKVAIAANGHFMEGNSNSEPFKTRFAIKRRHLRKELDGTKALVKS